MALADIITKVESDAQAEAHRILDAARARADAARTDAERRATEHRERALAEAEASARREASRVVTEARLAARDGAVSRRRELVDDAFSQVVEALASAPDDRYAVFLARRIADTARPGNELFLGAADGGRAEAVREALDAVAPGLSLHLAEGPAPFEHGALVEGDRVRADLSLDAIVRERRDELELIVASRLFEEEA